MRLPNRNPSTEIDCENRDEKGQNFFAPKYANILGVVCKQILGRKNAAIFCRIPQAISVLGLKGFTITEILLVTALTGIIISVASNSLFKNFIGVWWNQKGSLTIQNQAKAVIGQIEKDLKSCSRTSLGSCLLNGGFEEMVNNMPSHWQPPLPEEITYYLTGNNDVVHSGYASIGVCRASSDLNYTSDTLTLKQDAAYMLTFFIRTSTTSATGEVALIRESNGEVLASTGTATTTWTRLVLRYPETGVLNNELAIKISLSAKNNPGRVYFDDISVKPIRVILASPNEVVNIDMSTTTLSGYRFERTEGQNRVLCRYRVVEEIDDGVVAKQFYREKFNQALNTWEIDGYNQMVKNINRLIFAFDENQNLPLAGHDTPLSIDLEFEIAIEGGGIKRYQLKTQIYPDVS